MNATIVLLVAISAIVVLGGAAAVLTTRRRDETAVGRLSSRTMRSDRPVVQRTSSTNGADTRAGRRVEAAALAGRHAATNATANGDAAIVPIETAVDLPTPWRAPDPEAAGVNRRQFLNRASLGLMGLSASGFGAASLAFLWPKAAGGFGSKVKVGTRAEVDQAIAGSQPATNFGYFPEAQAYVQPYPAEALDAARGVYDERLLPALEEGYVALWQKCPHLGCRVPSCETSQWFECPCHGSQYNRVGEKKAGPAPRGMDRFPILLEGDDVIIDTGTVIPGATPGVNTTNQGQEGPNCTSGGHG